MKRKSLRFSTTISFANLVEVILAFIEIAVLTLRSNLIFRKSSRKTRYSILKQKWNVVKRGKKLSIFVFWFIIQKAVFCCFFFNKKGFFVFFFLSFFPSAILSLFWSLIWVTPRSAVFSSFDMDRFLKYSSPLGTSGSSTWLTCDLMSSNAGLQWPFCLLWGRMARQRVGERRCLRRKKMQGDRTVWKRLVSPH